MNTATTFNLKPGLPSTPDPSRDFDPVAWMSDHYNRTRLRYAWVSFADEVGWRLDVECLGTFVFGENPAETREWVQVEFADYLCQLWREGRL